MIAQIKNLARHSSVYTLSTFVQRALGFILLPVYTDTVYIHSRSAYGDMTLVYTFIAFMTIVYLYGMDTAVMRYFFLGKFQREEVYSTAFWGVLLNALFLSAVLIWQAPFISYYLLGNSGYTMFIYSAAGILLFDSLGNLPYLVLRAEEKSLLYSAVRVGRFILELGLNIFFVVYLKKGVLGILYANLLASLLNLLALTPFQIKYLRGRPGWQTFKTLSAFGLPMLPNGLAYLTVEVSEKYLMRLLLDKDTLGIYAPNYKFGSLLLLVVMAFRTAWQPFFLKVAKENSAPQRIYSKVMTYFTLAAAWLVVLGSFFIEYLLRLPLGGGRTIMGRAYWAGIEIIPIVLAAYLFYGIYVNLTVGVYIKKKTQWMVIFTGLAALVNVGGNFYLMPHFGIMGAAVAKLLSYAVMALSIYLASRRIYPVSYEYGRLLFILLFLAAMLTIYYAWHPAVGMRLLLILLSGVFFVIFFIKKEEIRALKTLGKNLKRIK